MDLSRDVSVVYVYIYIYIYICMGLSFFEGTHMHISYVLG